MGDHSPVRKVWSNILASSSQQRGFPHIVFCSLEKDMKFSFFSMSGPCHRRRLSQRLPAGRGLRSFTILVKPPPRCSSYNPFFSALGGRLAGCGEYLRMRHVWKRREIASLVLVTIFNANYLLLAAATSHHWVIVNFL